MTNIPYIPIAVILFIGLVLRVLYIIGKNVKKKEAEIQSQVKKQFVDGKKTRRYLKYSRKSTPKVPSNKS